MIDTKIPETLSKAYIIAVCAYNGIAVERFEYDEDSVDCMMHKVISDANGNQYGVDISVQLKATAQELVGDDEGFNFPLKIKNFHDLRMHSSTLRILCVLRLPRDQTKWVTHSIEELIVRNCMYWCDVNKYENSDNESTVSIKIPWANAFTPEAALELMYTASETNRQ